MNEHVNTEYGKTKLTFTCTLWIPMDGDRRPTHRFALRLLLVVLYTYHL